MKAFAQGQCHEATRFLFAQRYALKEPDFVALATWYFAQLNAYDDATLARAAYSRAEIAQGLEQLAQIQRGER